MRYFRNKEKGRDLLRKIIGIRAARTFISCQEENRRRFSFGAPPNLPFGPSSVLLLFRTLHCAVCKTNTGSPVIAYGV